jgi:hypothetical protein
MFQPTPQQRRDASPLYEPEGLKANLTGLPAR